jgi:hypothetical protein
MPITEIQAGKCSTNMKPRNPAKDQVDSERKRKVHNTPARNNAPKDRHATNVANENCHFVLRPEFITR